MAVELLCKECRECPVVQRVRELLEELKDAKEQVRDALNASRFRVDGLKPIEGDE